MRRARLPLLVVALLLPGVALGQDDGLCARAGGEFYGPPVTLSYAFDVRPSVPREPLPGLGGIFPPPGSGGVDNFVCTGGSLVGALNCVTAAITGAGSDPAPATDGVTAPDAPGTDPEAEADPEAVPAAPEPDDGRVHLTMTFRPVYTPGDPTRMRLEPAGPADIARPTELSDDEVAFASARIAAQAEVLAAYSRPLSAEETEALIDGAGLADAVPPAVPGAAASGTPPAPALPVACASHFRAYAEQARLRGLRGEVQSTIDRLEAQLKAEREKAGWLGSVWDSELVDRIERRLELERGKLGRIDAALAEQGALIDRGDARLAANDRRAELDAIRADPARLAAETARRREALLQAARDQAKFKWQMIEGEKSYAQQIAAYDALIARAESEGNDAYAEALRTDQGRIIATRDSWRESVEGMYQSRTAEQRRLIAENAADGIGPTLGATEMLLAEGRDPVAEIETGARARAAESIAGRVSADAASLGGSATEPYGVEDFARDMGEANAELLADPTLFATRYGAYLGGVGAATSDAVRDLAMLAAEAGDTAGEAFESGLSDVTGYEYNAFGRENLDTIVRAGTFVSETDAAAIGEIAGGLADRAARRVEIMAGQGEAGIEAALHTTGYATATVVAAEEIAIAAALRGGRIVGNIVRGTDAVTDAARVANAAADASRMANAATDVNRAADAATDASRMADIPRIDPVPSPAPARLPDTPAPGPAAPGPATPTPPPPAPVIPGPVDPPPRLPDTDGEVTVNLDRPLDAPGLDPVRVNPTTPDQPVAPPAPATPPPSNRGLIDALTNPSPSPSPSPSPTPGPATPPDIAPAVPQPATPVTRAEDARPTLRLDRPVDPGPAPVPDPTPAPGPTPTPGPTPDLPVTERFPPPSPNAPGPARPQPSSPGPAPSPSPGPLPTPAPTPPPPPPTPGPVPDPLGPMPSPAPAPLPPRTPDLPGEGRIDFDPPDLEDIPPPLPPVAPEAAMAGLLPPGLRPAVPAAPHERLARIGDVAAATDGPPGLRNFLETHVAPGRTPEEVAAYAVGDGYVTPEELLNAGAVDEAGLRRALAAYHVRYDDMHPVNAAILADREVGGVGLALANAGLNPRAVDLYERAAISANKDAVVAGAGASNKLDPREIIATGVIDEAGLRRGMDEYLRGASNIQSAAERQRLIENYLMPLRPAVRPPLPPVARFPQGQQPVPVAAVDAAGQPLLLGREREPFATGSNNTFHRLAPPHEGKLLRQSLHAPDAPETRIDRFGREALSDPRIDPGVVRPLEAETVTLPDGSRAEIVPFDNRRAVDQFAANADGQPTTGQAIALDRALRELNAKGYVWLDNHPANYFLEPIPNTTDQWRVVVLDPGGVVRATGPDAARDVQAAVVKPRARFLESIASLSPEGHVRALRNVEEGARIVGRHAKDLDLTFGTGVPLADAFVARGDGMVGLQRSQDLFDIDPDDIETAYRTLLETGTLPE